MNFRFFYLWLRSSTVLPYSLSKNRLFIERCLARRKLFSSYSNLIQNSLWTSTQHPLFSKGQFRLFKLQIRRTFIRILFVVIFYCLSYGTYTFFTQTGSLWSRFFFLISLLQLFYLLFVNVLFSFFFLLFNSLIVLSDFLNFKFLKSFVNYAKQYIIHRTFLATFTPVQGPDDIVFPESAYQINIQTTESYSELNKLLLNFFRLKKSTEYQLNFVKAFSNLPYTQGLAKVDNFVGLEDYFSIKYNLSGFLFFQFQSENIFNEFWAYYWDLIYKKRIHFSLIHHWLSTNPILSYSDLRLAAESFSLFSVPQTKLNASAVNNLSAFNAFRQSSVFLLARQFSFFQSSLFFKAKTARLLQDNSLVFEPYTYKSLRSFLTLGDFLFYLNFFNKDLFFTHFNSNFLHTPQFSLLSSLSEFSFLYPRSYFFQTTINSSISNLQLLSFSFNILFNDNDLIFNNICTPTIFSRNSRVRLNYLN